MPIYLGTENTKGYKVSPILQALGINMIRTSYHDLPTIVTPTFYQIAYRTYIGLLPAYMRATFTKSRVVVSEPYHPISYKVLETIPLKYPNLAVSFQKTPNEVVEQMKDWGFEESIVKGRRIAIIHSEVTAEMVAVLKKGGADVSCPAPGNTINLAAIPTLVLIKKIVSAFLRTHSYPAFRDDEHFNNIQKLETELAYGKRKLMDSATEISDEPPRKKGPAAVPSGSSSMEVDPIEGSSDIIRVALPQDQVPGWSETDINDVPTTAGLYIRFVSDLAAYDAKTVPRIIQTYFMGCLGATKEESISRLEEVRAKWGVIQDTDLGLALSHLFACIDIGLRAQARIFPIFSEGYYQGSLISGCGYLIKISSTIHSPLSPEALQNDLRRTLGHGSILEAITEAVTSTETVAGEMILKSRSMWDLRVALKEVTCDEGERDEAVKLAAQLRFERHWPLNSTTILKAYSLIAQPELPLDGLPIHHSALFEKDRVALVLSSFGVLAPSCHFIGGPIKDVPRDCQGPISFKMVELRQAVSDVHSMISNKKFCGAQGKRRSGQYKDRLFSGKEASPIWESIKKMCGAMTAGSSSNVVGFSTTSSALVDDGEI